MQKIAPCLWFDGKAEEAMNFYTSIFKNSKDAEKSKRVMQAMLKMVKLDIRVLKHAYEQG
jgi:predicted 3-demethylubiquinone-9 3-methyltransferase (glyoxalase superfamily)